MSEPVPGVYTPEQGRPQSNDPRDMRNNTWVLCGRCERIMDGVPVGSAGITVDGLMVIREAGWQWNGISWECDGCSVFFDSDPVFRCAPAPPHV